MAWAVLIGFILLCYLIGSIPFGYIVARARGVDIFSQGSGNIGATNVGRILGRRFGILVFLLDFAKGALPTLLGQFLAGMVAVPDLPPATVPVLAGVAAFLGHLFPIYLRLRGGKGVATGAGVVLILMPVPMAAAFLTWLVVVAASRYVSLASILAVIVLSKVQFLMTLPSGPFSPTHGVTTSFALFAALVVILRHQGNIRRLLAGTENRIGDTAMMAGLLRTLHVLSLGLCLGTLVFFTLMGIVLFSTWERISAMPAKDRPLWLPVPEVLEKARASEKFPDPLRKEQGSRIAGAVVGPLFPWYYGIQVATLGIATITAISWIGQRRIGRLRILVLGVALFGGLAGMALEQKVEDLRVPRNHLSDQVILSPAPGPDLIHQAEAARATFGMWHGISLLLNFLTLGLTILGMILAASLPSPNHSSLNGNSNDHNSGTSSGNATPGVPAAV